LSEIANPTGLAKYVIFSHLSLNFNFEIIPGNEGAGGQV
jgi:hypothetical protein